ncbi:MAG: ATP-binding protein, partial [Luteibacter sp.]
PHLLLQPLVENAIRHGIAPLPEGGRRGIRVEREAGALRVSVENDMPEASDRSGGQGLGLTNVRARLEALYPDDHRIDVDGHAASWRVVIRLPLRVPPGAP